MIIFGNIPRFNITACFLHYSYKSHIKDDTLKRHEQKSQTCNDEYNELNFTGKFQISFLSLEGQVEKVKKKYMFVIPWNIFSLYFEMNVQITHQIINAHIVNCKYNELKPEINTFAAPFVEQLLLQSIYVHNMTHKFKMSECVNKVNGENQLLIKKLSNLG